MDSDPNPLVNTVTVHYNPIGFPNDITATATASVTIVEGPEPAITIEKKASHYSKVGDELDNLYKICNVGPIAVMRVSVIDELLGDITLSFAASLAPTECTEAHLMYTVQPGDPDPLNPVVTAIYSGMGTTPRRRTMPSRTSSSRASMSPRAARLIRSRSARSRPARSS